MKLSVFSTLTDPLERGDPLFQAIEGYGDLADELVLVDGSKESRLKDGYHEVGSGIVRAVNHEWPDEFKWDLIGQQFQRGYEASGGDWVIHCDLDFIFHERDYGKIRQALKDYPSSPAVSFYKYQFIQPDRYNLKSRLILAVNKGAFGDRITFSGSGDLCQPQLDGRDLDLNEMPQAGVPFYNYEHILKTKEQSMADVGRMDRAYQRHFGKWLYSKDGTDESAYEGWLAMMLGRYARPSKQIPLHEHPRAMQETISLLKHDQFGYNAFGNLSVNDYQKG